MGAFVKGEPQMQKQCVCHWKTICGYQIFHYRKHFMFEVEREDRRKEQEKERRKREKRRKQM